VAAAVEALPVVMAAVGKVVVLLDRTVLQTLAAVAVAVEVLAAVLTRVALVVREL
jgi:hypothetical protein